MNPSKISFPLIAKKPTNLLVAPALVMVLGAAVLAVTASSALGGGLQDLEQQTLIAVYVIIALAFVVFLGGLAWMLSIVRFQLTFPDRDHLVLRTLKRTTSCAILDIDASTTAASGNTLLVFKDETGHSLGYLESQARHWDECVAVVKDAHLREKKRAWYQQMVDTVWYCPVRDDAICIKWVEGENMTFIFVADEVEVARTLADEVDAVAAFSIEDLVQLVDNSGDDWVLMFNVRDGAERHSMDAYGWSDAREMLGL